MLRGIAVPREPSHCSGVVFYDGYGFHLCPQFIQTLYIFLLVTAPTAPASGFIANPTRPRLTLNFLFVVVIEVLPHFGQQTIPFFLFCLIRCFFDNGFSVLELLTVLFIVGEV